MHIKLHIKLHIKCTFEGTLGSAWNAQSMCFIADWTRQNIHGSDCNVHSMTVLLVFSSNSTSCLQNRRGCLQNRRGWPRGGGGGNNPTAPLFTADTLGHSGTLAARKRRWRSHGLFDKPKWILLPGRQISPPSFLSKRREGKSICRYLAWPNQTVAAAMSHSLQHMSYLRCTLDVL